MLDGPKTENPIEKIAKTAKPKIPMPPSVSDPCVFSTQFRKYLDNLSEVFGANGSPSPWEKVARTPTSGHLWTRRKNSLLSCDQISSPLNP